MTPRYHEGQVLVRKDSPGQTFRIGVITEFPERIGYELRPLFSTFPPRLRLFEREVDRDFCLLT